MRPASPPKFLRDSMNVDDIRGAQPKRWFDGQPRDHMSNLDIEGA